MSQEPFNLNFPFNLGLQQDAFGLGNPMLTGLKVMQEAWQSFSAMAPQVASASMDPDELDKRIEELKTVESWLKLNLSILTNTIHGLEAQKEGLRQFNQWMGMMNMPYHTDSATTDNTGSDRTESDNATAATTSADSATSPTPQASDAGTEAHQTGTTSSDEETPTNAAPTASALWDAGAKMHEQMQGQALHWFNQLGQQFQGILASVAATDPTRLMSSGDTAQASTSTATATSSATSTKATTSTKTPSTQAAASKKTTAKKTTAKKATPKKTSSKKTAAKKTATKVTGAKKASAKQATVKPATVTKATSKKTSSSPNN